MLDNLNAHSIRIPEHTQIVSNFFRCSLKQFRSDCCYTYVNSLTHYVNFKFSLRKLEFYKSPQKIQ